MTAETNTGISTTPGQCVFHDHHAWTGRPISEAVAVEIAGGAGREGEEGGQARGGRREAHPSPTQIDARRERDQEDVKERGEDGRGLAEGSAEAEDERAQEVRQRLIAPPERIAERPLRDPRIQERLAVLQAGFEPLGSGAVKDEVVQGRPADAQLGGQEEGVERDRTGDEEKAERPPVQRRVGPRG